MGFRRDAQRADRPDHHRIAHRFEFACREERRLAELRHIREQLHARHARANSLNISASVKASGKIASAPELIKLGAGDGAFHAFAARGIGASDDKEMAARFCGGGDLRRQSCGSASFLSLRCPHFFGRADLRYSRRQRRVLKGPDHMHDVQCLAIACVAIDQNREVEERAI